MDAGEVGTGETAVGYSACSAVAGTLAQSYRAQEVSGSSNMTTSAKAINITIMPTSCVA